MATTRENLQVSELALSRVLKTSRFLTAKYLSAAEIYPVGMIGNSKLYNLNDAQLKTLEGLAASAGKNFESKVESIKSDNERSFFLMQNINDTARLLKELQAREKSANGIE